MYSFEAYLPGFLRGLIHDKMTALRVFLIQNGMMADNPRAGSESQVVRAAREAYEAVDKDLGNSLNARDNEKADLEKDYGPSDIFRSAKGGCISLDAGEYEYEMCWLDKTMQKSKKGHGSTNMGNFAKLEWRTADDEERLDGKSLGKGERMVLRYDSGQQCWNGPQRSTEVWLGCAEEEELWRVSEAEKCVYKMEVGTPAACGAVEKQGHDEL